MGDCWGGKVGGSWFYSRVGCRVSPKFHLFVFDVNQRNKVTRWNCHWNCMHLFGGLQLVADAEKWDDHQRKKFFINNYVEALILFKEEHQGGPILKLHVPLGCWKKWHKKSPKKRIFFETEK